MRLLALILLACGLFVTQCFAEQLTYKGRPIYAWLEELLDENASKREAAQRELRIMGTNALPTMLNCVTSYRAVFGSRDSGIVYPSFSILGPVAKPAIPELVHLANDVN